MTEMDIRIAFKMDTGYYPLWAKNHNGDTICNFDYSHKFTFIKGSPSSIYGKWLEEKSGRSSKYLRELYYKVTGKEPIRDYFNFSYNKKDIFKIDYCFWLESFILQNRQEVIKDIIHLK